jgi:hypothetical protein
MSFFSHVVVLSCYSVFGGGSSERNASQIIRNHPQKGAVEVGMDYEIDPLEGFKLSTVEEGKGELNMDTSRTLMIFQ